MYYKRIQTPLGSIRIEADNKGICNISFCQEEEKEPQKDWEDKDCQVLLQAEKQLIEYMQADEKNLSCQLSVQGTEFQRKVWRELVIYLMARQELMDRLQH